MRVMVVGGGGREHALAWKISSSPLVDEVICVPGNGGIASVARCLPAPEGVAGIVELARAEGVDLVVVGPEAELAAGLVDQLGDAGIDAFGPSAQAARLEASKAFAKEVMAAAGVPTASWSEHHHVDSALRAAQQRGGKCVVKADGLAAGKGVIVCRSQDEAEVAIRTILEQGAFGAAGAKVVVEDLLEGEELSVLALCDGRQIIPMIAAQDHKAAYDGDEGPNTGGMGAYAPAPAGDDALLLEVRRQVLEPTAAEMARRGHPIKGVLYAGLMLVDGEPYVLEFNVRFGDPETQPLLTMLGEDLVPLLVESARGDFGARSSLSWRDGVAVCVVLAAGGYPGSYEKGAVISGLDEAAAMEDVVVFHAGTARNEQERCVTSGGRVLGVTAVGADVATARDRAYAAASCISFDGVQYRRDIAHRALARS